MFLPFFLYAEIHHKYKLIPNFLYQKEPEIFMDFPRRVNPDVKKVPFVINIKDANKFPIVLKNITVKILNPGKKIQKTLFEGREKINTRLYQNIFYFKKSNNLEGEFPIVIEIHYYINKKEKIVTNHNYKKGPKSLWYIRFSKDHLPAEKNWYPGDIHFHTSYSEDDVEFGQSPKFSKELGLASGIYFLGLTDHSYDLDDKDGKYYEKDPDLKKWKKFKRDVSRINSKSVNFVLLPGEEVSTGNSKNKNVHALLFGHDKFIPGTGDSTDQPFKNKPDSKLEKFASSIPLSIAAHPFEGYSFLPALFLRRGKWQNEDFEHVDGIQFYNGLKNQGYFKGKEKWIELLLKGKKIFTYAGTDAHGDFNRAFKVKIPFLKLVESTKQIAGRVKTYVYSNKKPNKKLLIKGLKNGNVFISDGPFINIYYKSINDNKYIIGKSINTNKPGKLVVKTKSSGEFGKLKQLRIYKGNLKEKKEEILLNKNINSFENREIINYNCNGERVYIRAEVLTLKNKEALTNPLFFNY